MIWNSELSLRCLFHARDYTENIGDLKLNMKCF